MPGKNSALRRAMAKIDVEQRVYYNVDILKTFKNPYTESDKRYKMYTNFMNSYIDFMDIMDIMGGSSLNLRPRTIPSDIVPYEDLHLH